MFKRLPKLVFLLTMVLLFVAIMPDLALAENLGITAANFQIEVKPEYDDPRTLVIYQGDLVNLGTATIPKNTPVSFIIPKGAEIGMACEINDQKGHDCQPYMIQDIGDNKVKLSWKMTKNVASGQKYPTYLEFYYDNGSVAPQKNFDYNFQPTFAIDNLDLNITAPKAATQVNFIPVAAATIKDSEGLNRYTFNYKKQTPKDNLLIKVSYTKADNQPSFDKTQTAGPQSSTEGSNWLSKPEFLVPVLLLIAILVLGIIFGLKKKRGQK